MCQFEIEKYITYSKLEAHKKKVKSAVETVQKALSLSNSPALSFSAGKDSVVMLDIAIKAGFCGELVFFRYGLCCDVETPRENVELLSHYAKLHGLHYTILDCLGESDCWERCGRFTLFPENEDEKAAFRTTNYDFAKKSLEFEKEHGIDLNIIGMRKDESKRRRLVLSKNGAIYQTKSRKSLTCCPLKNFTNDDIWAYIFSNKLRYLRIYDYPNLDRREIRNEITLLYNYSIIRSGMLFHFKQMYPKFFEWISRRWGDVA